MSINKVRKILLGELIGLLVIVLVVAVLFEINLILPGELSGMEWSNDLVITQFIMQLLTLTVIPFTLYMFKLPFLKKQLAISLLKSINILLIWGSIRIGLLCFPLLLNVLFYYLFGFERSFFYLSLILLLSIAFVYPSKKRCEYECHLTDQK